MVPFPKLSPSFPLLIQTASATAAVSASIPDRIIFFIMARRLFLRRISLLLRSRRSRRTASSSYLFSTKCSRTSFPFLSGEALPKSRSRMLPLYSKSLPVYKYFMLSGQPVSRTCDKKQLSCARGMRIIEVGQAKAGKTFSRSDTTCQEQNTRIFTEI